MPPPLHPLTHDQMSNEVFKCQLCTWKASCQTKLNPLSLNSFPNSTHYVHPARHFCRCSSPTFAQRGKHMESPSGNTINDIHDHPEAKQLGIKSGDWTDFLCRTSPKQTRSQWWYITHTSVQSRPRQIIIFFFSACKLPYDTFKMYL